MQFVSVAKKYSLDVYRFSSRALVALFPESTFRVIVPDHQTRDFEKSLPGEVQVESELEYDSGFFEHLHEECSQVNPPRKGWYLQQFIKLEFLRRQSQVGESVVIWDADAIPLKRIDFFDRLGRPRLFTSTEETVDNRGNRFEPIHQPYFQVIENVLGIGRAWDFSFIAQTMPVSAELARSFFSEIENRTGQIWWQAIINAIDFSENSGFSEYETLGAFMYGKHPERISFQSDKWRLDGWSSHGTPRKAWKASRKIRAADNVALVGFEVWQKPSSIEEWITGFLNPKNWRVQRND